MMLMQLSQRLAHHLAYQSFGGSVRLEQTQDLKTIPEPHQDCLVHCDWLEEDQGSIPIII